LSNGRNELTPGGGGWYSPAAMLKSEDVYKRLARHLDELPAGFPPLESGVEIRILKRLFSEEEAEMDNRQPMSLQKRYINEEGNVYEKIAKKISIFIFHTCYTSFQP
jgi:hypothetical protein